MKLCWNHRPILEAIRIDDIPRDFRGFQPLISLRPHETTQILGPLHFQTRTQIQINLLVIYPVCSPIKSLSPLRTYHYICI